jgi:ligand-binding SRPBCC domain-containing protein
MAHTFVLRDEIVVQAPVKRCFLLSTSVEIVAITLKMRPVRGRISGLITDGDKVRWEGWVFGLPQHHESLIGPFEPPVFFRDSMLTGRFSSFEHSHHFFDQGDGSVRLSDEVRFRMRLGWAGYLAGKWILAPHIRGLLRRRFALLKEIAEGRGWQNYLWQTTEAE